MKINAVIFFFFVPALVAGTSLGASQHQQQEVLVDDDKFLNLINEYALRDLLLRRSTVPTVLIIDPSIRRVNPNVKDDYPAEQELLAYCAKHHIGQYAPRRFIIGPRKPSIVLLFTPLRGDPRRRWALSVGGVDKETYTLMNNKGFQAFDHYIRDRLGFHELANSQICSEGVTKALVEQIWPRVKKKRN